MTPHEFISKWHASALKERSAAQEHFIDLCRLLGDWKRHHCARKYKCKRADLDAAVRSGRSHAKRVPGTKKIAAMETARTIAEPVPTPPFGPRRKRTASGQGKKR